MLARKRAIRWLVVALLILAALYYFVFANQYVVAYKDDRDHFKYGSIGSEPANGLPILVRPSQSFPDLDRYYAECVTGGPGSFVLPIRQSSEFATAIRRKLIMEVSGVSPPPRVVAAQTLPPVDCERGERQRRLFSDPYYPELDR